MDGALMRIEDLLKRVPDRAPAPPAATSDRVRTRVLGAIVNPPQSRFARRAYLLAAAVAVGAIAFGTGYWTGPTHAAADLTIGVRPEAVPAYQSTQVTVFGSVPSGRAGEAVAVDAKQCGLGDAFHQLEGVRSEAQGVWSLPVPHYTPGVVNPNSSYVNTKTSFRIRWNNRASESVTVVAHAGVFIQQLPAKRQRTGKRRFQIVVLAPQVKFRPRVVVERRSGQSWKPVARVVVPLSAARNHSVALWLPASRGEVLRARLPAAEAAPCYPAEVGTPAPPIK
jgi:hypothetical protein